MKEFERLEIEKRLRIIVVRNHESALTLMLKTFCNNPSGSSAEYYNLVKMIQEQIHDNEFVMAHFLGSHFDFFKNYLLPAKYRVSPKQVVAA